MTGGGMQPCRDRRSPPSGRPALVGAALLVAGTGMGCGGAVRPPEPPGPSEEARLPADVAAVRAPLRQYAMYVGTTSDPPVRRVRFGPGGVVAEATPSVGAGPDATGAAPGLGLSPQGRFLYVTTGVDGSVAGLWKLHAGPDTAVADPVRLGHAPATLAVTPDGLYAFVAGADTGTGSAAAALSVVYTPDLVEVTQVETCRMPRVGGASPGGVFVYVVCPGEDQLVEVDTRTFEVSRRFSLTPGREGALGREVAPTGRRPPDTGQERCAPTWAEPSVDGAHVFVVCSGTDVIHEISWDSWSVSRTFGTGPGPFHAAASPDGRWLVATLAAQGEVEFLDVLRGISAGRTPTSAGAPHGVVISPDSGYAFVTTEGLEAASGKVEVYELPTRRRTADAELGGQAGSIVFWRMDPPR